MSPRHARPAALGPGDRLVRVGAVLFAIGLVAVVVAVVPSVVADRSAPQALVLLAGALLPVGLGVALAGLVRAARARSPRP